MIIGFSRKRQNKARVDDTYKIRGALEHKENLPLTGVDRIILKWILNKVLGYGISQLNSECVHRLALSGVMKVVNNIEPKFKFKEMEFRYLKTELQNESSKQTISFQG